jgi:hypothetical protein
MKKMIVLAILFAAACKTSKSTVGYEKALVRATVAQWSSGVRGGGRGATFQLHFYQLSKKLRSDTLWVNGIPLKTELQTNEDTTIVSSSFFTEKVEEKTLANALEYSGRLRFIADEKAHYLNIEQFEIIDTEPRP